MKRLMILGLTLLSLIGCRSVQRTEVIGLWEMSDASRQVLPTEFQAAKPTLHIDSNGTFLAQDMPGLLAFPAFRETRLDSGRGNWKLLTGDGNQQIQLNFEVINDWKNRPLPYGTHLNISSGSSISVYYFLGDADEGRKIEFKKK